MAKQILDIKGGNDGASKDNIFSTKADGLQNTLERRPTNAEVFEAFAKEMDEGFERMLKESGSTFQPEKW